MQGMNFSSPASQTPAAIPQMSVPPPPIAPFTQPPPPGSSQNQNASNTNSSPGTFQGPPGSAYQQWILSRQQKQTGQQGQTQQQLPTQAPGTGGPKPIRFQLQPKRGGKKFNNRAFGSNPNSEDFVSDTTNPNFLPLGKRQGESGTVSQQQGWGQSAGDKRSALLPTPSINKPNASNTTSSCSLTEQQISNAMDPSDWPPSLQ